MRATYIISLITVSLSISSWAGNARPLSSTSSYPWTGFALTLQWPAGFCEVDENCDKDALLNTFTIHGLYPYKANRTQLVYCSGSEFDANSVSDFEAELHLAMPSLVTTQGDEKFWKHEWDKHGKCSEDLLDQTDYFRTSLAFRKTFDMVTILNREGISANDALYTTDSLKKAIVKNFNAEPAFSYKKNAKSELVLVEIVVCVNQLATRYIDCPYTPSPDSALKFVSLDSQLNGRYKAIVM